MKVSPQWAKKVTGIYILELIIKKFRTFNTQDPVSYLADLFIHSKDIVGVTKILSLHF